MERAGNQIIGVDEFHGKNLPELKKRPLFSSTWGVTLEGRGKMD